MRAESLPQRLTGDDAPMVRFASVTKRYGSLTVLDRLDLDVAANEMVSIIGPSGSGKTTVLRMLMTLEEIDEGVIYVAGEPLDKDVCTVNEHTRRVFTERDCDPGATIRRFRIVQTERSRQVEREADSYNLDVILSLGYRVTCPPRRHSRDSLSRN